MVGALSNIRVLDLSRVLAGPYCTQMLGDLGAEIIKIERPNTGDDTRYWGPPFLKNAHDEDTTESAYYLSCNRNKKSVAIDLKTEAGQNLIRRLIAQSDVLIENFKVGGLKKYGLGYDDLKTQHPDLIYCSISGFGQSGPMAHEPGYDFLAQGMAGLMASTGVPDGQPMKVGVALSDIMTGMNAAIGILAALNHRNQAGYGQHVDVALTDSTLAALTNLAQYYLTSGQNPPRVGNAHATIVPYNVFDTKDGHIIIAVGNNEQFQRLCDAMNHPDWAMDERYRRNRDRVTHRETLTALIQTITTTKTTADWLTILHAARVPCGPVNTMDQVFAMEQIQHRRMNIQMDHPLSSDPVHLVGSPLKLSETPAVYNQAPPVLGAHTRDVLTNLLNLSDTEIEHLSTAGVIQVNTP